MGAPSFSVPLPVNAAFSEVAFLDAVALVIDKYRSVTLHVGLKSMAAAAQLKELLDKNMKNFVIEGLYVDEDLDYGFYVISGKVKQKCVHSEGVDGVPLFSGPLPEWLREER